MRGLRQEVIKLGYKPLIYEDYRSMFDEINPDIAVINCYFGDLAKVSEEALTRSINVFTEKPVATTLEDLEKLKKLMREVKKHSLPCWGLDISPGF